jgi:hypothetical protein
MEEREGGIYVHGSLGLCCCFQSHACKRPLARFRAAGRVGFSDEMGGDPAILTTGLQRICPRKKNTYGDQHLPPLLRRPAGWWRPDPSKARDLRAVVRVGEDQKNEIQKLVVKV